MNIRHPYLWEWHCHYQKCPAAFGSPKSVLNFVLLQRTCFEQSTASCYRYQWARLLIRIVFSNCPTDEYENHPHLDSESCISELSEPLPLNFQRHTNTNTAPWSFGRQLLGVSSLTWSEPLPLESCFGRTKHVDSIHQCNGVMNRNVTSDTNPNHLPIGSST